MSWIQYTAAVLLAFLFGVMAVPVPESIEAPITSTPIHNIPPHENEAAITTTEFFPKAEIVTESEPVIVPVPLPKKAIRSEASPAPTTHEGTPQAQVTRLKDPYPFTPMTDDRLNTVIRASLVNILCVLDNGQSVSGSGTIIDPRGVVITNAHVGQFVLLSEVSSAVTCMGRAGAPATAQWKLHTLFIPRTWVNEHASNLRTPNPTGTGEHDYALLLLEPLLGATVSPPYPFTPFDAREAVTFEGDAVILGAYPAGFVGGFTVQNGLYPATTFTTIKKLYTFKESSIDILSLGGVILAQGGSSGGAVVNRWGRLVGIIVTTSEGATTAERDLRAVSLAHVDRSIREHTGEDLGTFLAPDVVARAQMFRNNELAALAQKLVNEIPQQ